MPIKTKVSGSDPHSQPALGPQLRGSNFSGAGDAVGAAFEAVRQNNVKKENQWVSEQTMNAQLAVTKYNAEAFANPQQDQLEHFDEFWTGYTDEITKKAPSTEALDVIAQNLGQIEVSTMPKVFAAKASADRSAANMSVDHMLSAANDMIALNITPNALKTMQGQLNESIDGMVGLITTEQADKHKQNVRDLSLRAVDLWAPENPSVAREVLNSVKGIDSTTRASKLQYISNIEKQGAEVDNALWSADYSAYLASLEYGGTGSFDVDGYVSSFPSSKQTGKRSIINDDVAVAKGIYGFKQAIVGKPVNEVQTLLSKLAPEQQTEENNTRYDKQIRLYSQAAQIAAAYQSQIENDPYAAAGASDAVQQVASGYTSLAEDDEGKVPAFQDTIAANLRIQETLGVPKGKQKLMSATGLKNLATELNNGTPEEVVNRMSQLTLLYGQYYPDLFRNLGELPSGQRVSTELSMLQPHMAQGIVPPWAMNFVKATRMSTKELGFVDRDVTDYNEYTNKGSMVQLQQAMFGSSGSASINYLNTVRQATSKWAMYLKSTGQADRDKDAVNMAKSQLIDSIFRFGKAKGNTYAIPINQSWGKVSDADAEKIQKSLILAFDEGIMKDQSKVFGSSNKGKVGTLLHYTEIADTPFEGSAEFNSKTKADAIKANGYWATSQDMHGVTLMAKDISGTNRQVLGIDGEPIYRSFEEILAWHTAYKNRRY